MGQLDEVAGGALLNLYPPVDGLTEQLVGEVQDRFEPKKETDSV